MESYIGVVCLAWLVFAYDLRQSVVMSTNGQRFGEIVLARRLELDLTQLEVHAAGGPSNSTLTAIENGKLEKLERATAKKLDAGLQWMPGSARRAFDGGVPVPADTHGIRDLREVDAIAQIIGAANLDAVLRSRLLEVLQDETEERGA